MRWTPLVLAALLVVVQGDLWFGKGNLPYVMGLRKQLDEQRAPTRWRVSATSVWPPRWSTCAKAWRWSKKRRAPNWAW